MKLVYKKTGKRVFVGDRAKAWRGKAGQIIEIITPVQPWSVGYVFMRFNDGEIGQMWPNEIRAHWVDRKC